MCGVSLIKIDINNDFNKLEELSSNLPFPLSAAIIMHLQKKIEILLLKNEFLLVVSFAWFC